MCEQTMLLTKSILEHYIADIEDRERKKKWKKKSEKLEEKSCST